MLGYYNTKFHGLIIPFITIIYIPNLTHKMAIINFLIELIRYAHSRWYLIVPLNPEVYHYYQ